LKKRQCSKKHKLLCALPENEKTIGAASKADTEIELTEAGMIVMESPTETHSCLNDYKGDSCVEIYQSFQRECFPQPSGAASLASTLVQKSKVSIFFFFFFLGCY